MHIISIEKVLHLDSMLTKLIPCILMLLVSVSCATKVMPQDTVADYLTYAASNNHGDALLNWEMESVGIIDDSLNEDGRKTRIASRIDIEDTLYNTLNQMPKGFYSEFDNYILYESSDRGYTETDQVEKATLATVFFILQTNPPSIGNRTKIGFNLWLNDREQWKIVGLDKSKANLITIFEQQISDPDSKAN